MTVRIIIGDTLAKLKEHDRTSLFIDVYLVHPTGACVRTKSTPA